MQSGLQDALVGIVQQGGDIIAEQVTNAVAQFTNALVNGLDVRQADLYLSNERLLLMQNPDGSQNYDLLQNGAGQVEAVPAVRLPRAEWQNLHNDLAQRLNITPIDDMKVPELPDGFQGQPYDLAIKTNSMEWIKTAASPSCRLLIVHLFPVAVLQTNTRKNHHTTKIRSDFLLSHGHLKN